MITEQIELHFVLLPLLIALEIMLLPLPIEQL